MLIKRDNGVNNRAGIFVNWLLRKFNFLNDERSSNTFNGNSLRRFSSSPRHLRLINPRNNPFGKLAKRFFAKRSSSRFFKPRKHSKGNDTKWFEETSNNITAVLVKNVFFGTVRNLLEDISL